MSKEELIALKGDKGENGLIGDFGPKGVSGSLGPPGPIGPAGNPGSSVGSGFSNAEKAAFTVIRNINEYPRYSRPVKFSESLININNDFNLEEGDFTCRIAGVYYFVFHSVSEGDLCLNLISKNGADRVSLLFCDYNPRKTSISWVMSGGVVIELLVGQKVWLEPFKITG